MMRKFRKCFILSLTILAISRSATSVSSTVSTLSSTEELETTAIRDDTYTSNTPSGVSSTTDISTTKYMDTTVDPTSEISTTEPDTTTGDLSTTTAASDTTIEDLTTTTISNIDFTTSENVESTTTDLQTTTNEQSTTDFSKPTEFTDFTTISVGETTTTVFMLSTTAIVTSTSVDPDTTTADTTTTTTDSLETTTLSDITTSSKGEETTSTMSGQICQTTDSFEKDVVRSYIIVALSIALGILSIGVIIWCVVARVFMNEKKITISTGTQTDFFISKEIFVRPFPPIDTHMKKKNLDFKTDRNVYEDKNYPIDVCVEIDPDNSFADNKLHKLTESQCKERNNDQRSKECKESNALRSNIFSKSTDTLCMLNEDMNSINSDDTDISTEDMSILKSEDFFNLIFADESPSFVYSDSLASTTRLPRSVSYSDSNSSIDKMIEKCETGQSSEMLFERTSSISIIKQAREEARGKTNVIGVSMENKRPSFQMSYCSNDDEQFEEIITLDTDETKETKRHVTFEELKGKIMKENIHVKETEEDDCGATIISPKRSGLERSKTSTVGQTDKSGPEKLSVSRKRKRILKKKEINAEILNSLHLTHTQKRHLATYGIISNELIKPENIEVKIAKSVRKIEARKKLKAKYKQKQKMTQPKQEPKFQSEPYCSLYSRLSYFETI